MWRLADGLDVRTEEKRKVKYNFQIFSDFETIICENNLTSQNLKSPRVNFKAVDELISPVLDQKQRVSAFVSNIIQ